MLPVLWLNQILNRNNPVHDKLFPFMLHSLYPIESCFGIREADRVTQMNFSLSAVLMLVISFDNSNADNNSSCGMVVPPTGATRVFEPET